MKQRLLALFTKYRLLLLLIAVGGMLAYILASLKPISNPGIDEAYLKQLQSQQVTQLSVPDSLQQQLEKLKSTHINTSSTPAGSKDPFNP